MASCEREVPSDTDSDFDSSVSEENELCELTEATFVGSSQPQGYAFEPIRDILPHEGDKSPNNVNTSDSDADSQPDSPEPDRLQAMFWCLCGNCVPMPTQEECICCLEVGAIQHRIPDGQSPRCIQDNPLYNYVCTEREILDVSLLLMQDVRAGSLTRPIASRTYRLAAYRQFTMWAQGRLGKHVRRVIPACVVRNIRQHYPEANGIYKGFEHANL